MADETVQQKVQAAVMRAYELIAEEKVAKEALSAAKGEEDRVRENSAVPSVKQEAESIREATKYSEDLIRKNKEADAHVAVKSAQDKADKAVNDANAAYEKAADQAHQDFTAAVAQAERDQEQAMSVPAATVHEGRRELAAARDKWASHLTETERKLGLNLHKLVDL